jgi:hypothetical protein
MMEHLELTTKLNDIDEKIAQRKQQGLPFIKLAIQRKMIITQYNTEKKMRLVLQND